MDRDKMREEIENWFMENVDCEDDHFFPRDKARYFTKNLLSLLAPVFEKAEKWEKVEELARYKGDCGYCKNDDLCMKFPSSACYICEGVVHALKEAP
jgi:hypothetical protein